MCPECINAPIRPAADFSGRDHIAFQNRSTSDEGFPWVNTQLNKHFTAISFLVGLGINPFITGVGRNTQTGFRIV